LARGSQSTLRMNTDDFATLVDRVERLAPRRRAGWPPVALSPEARRNAVAFLRLVHGTFGPAVRLPTLSATVDGGYALRWAVSGARGWRLVELVFFLDRIEYVVVDGEDLTDVATRVVDGETTDPALVVREIVKPYVAGP